MKKFRVHPDGRVVEMATSECLGWVDWHGAYFPLDASRKPIAGPSVIEDIAALAVIRYAGHADAILLDIEATD